MTDKLDMTERNADGTLMRGAAPAPVADSQTPSPYGPPEMAPPPRPNVEEGPVRLVIPHVFCKPETRAIGEQMNATFVDVTGDDQGYFKLVTRLWAGRGFILCEQDVKPSVDLLNELWACTAEWCVGWFWTWGGTMMEGDMRPQHPWRHRSTETLALSKFGTTLLRRAPRAMQDAAARTNGRQHFNGLDLALVHPGGVLQNHPYFAEPHLHGPVGHRPEPPWLPQIADSEWRDG